MKRRLGGGLHSGFVTPAVRNEALALLDNAAVRTWQNSYATTRGKKAA